MDTAPSWKIQTPDVKVLRALAARVREISKDPLQEELRHLWKANNALRGERPMVLLESHAISDELGIEAGLRCREAWARECEETLVRMIYQYENVRDDVVVEPHFNCNWKVTVSNYGVEAPREYGDNEGRLASYHWDPPVKDLDRDYGLLHARTYSVDREGTVSWKAHLEGVLGDILPVRIRGEFWWTMGMTWEAIKLVGLEQLMLLMYDNPKGLHRLMAFLRDDHLAFARWLEREGLLTLNNENDYIGSGSRGHTDELPQKGRHKGDRVRLEDLWVLSESQETVGVGPALFEEFVFPYQLAVAEKFGLLYYGCCEPVHSRWHIIRRLPNLRKVSVSPWCDEAFMAEALGRDYVYCRKPNPALISTERFDETAIREDLRKTLEAARGCNIELVMKDVHTVSGQPARLGRWVQIARETIEERP